MRVAISRLPYLSQTLTGFPKGGVDYLELSSQGVWSGVVSHVDQGSVRFLWLGGRAAELGQAPLIGEGAFVHRDEVRVAVVGALQLVTLEGDVHLKEKRKGGGESNHHPPEDPCPPPPQACMG